MQVTSLLASPSLRSSSSGTSCSISGKSCRSSSRMCASSSPPAASNVSRSRMPAASAMSSLRANPPELHVLDACLAEESRLRLDVPQQAGRCEGGTSCTHALLL